MNSFLQKVLKYCLRPIAFGLVVLVSWVFYFLLSDTLNPYDNTINSALIPQFSQVNLPFEHKFDSVNSLPLIWSTLIDIDQDGIDELFVGWWRDQHDGFFKYTDGKFIGIDSLLPTQKSANLTTLAASSVDIDNNGREDLIVSRENWVTVYYTQAWEITNQKLLDLEIDPSSTAAWLTFWDIDKDWDLDLFMSAYLQKENIDGFTNFSKDYGAYSELYLNNGDWEFTQYTDAAGLRYQHNTFQWVFVDVDNDTWLDLVVAYDTGEPRVYKNNGDTTFTNMPTPYTDTYSYPMGVWVWDYNNNGLTDFFFSNIWSSVPKFMAKWNLENTDNLFPEWFLFDNQWSFSFKDDAPRAKVADFEFSRWGVFADMNNDSLQDLIVSENYVNFPAHKVSWLRLPWRFLIQKSDNTFVATEKESWVINRHYGITPLVSDFNEDGNLDLVWINIDGPMQTLLSNESTWNYLKIQTVQNAKTIWAKITVTTSSGTKITEDLITGEWLSSNQSSTVHFGLWEDTVDTLTILLPSWTQEVLEDIETNSTLSLF